jgi:hypothetical protein
MRMQQSSYQCIFPQQVLLRKLNTIHIFQREWSANFRLPISFTHLHCPLPLQPRFLVLEVNYHGGAGPAEQKG